VVILARVSGIFLNIFLLLFLITQPGAATPAQKKTGASSTSSADKAASKSKPDSAEKKEEAAVKPAEPLTPEISHRILTEIRSRYNVPSQISIALSEPKQGKTPGYDDVTVTFTGGTHTTKHDFLISKDRKTLAHLETIDISQDLMSKIDVKGRPVKGNPNAKITIVNYDDFQCPFCSRMHSTLFSNVFKDYADRVRVIYKDYPLVEIHPWAIHAAVDGNCLGEQNSQAYWDFADYIHANQKLVAGKSSTEAFANLDAAAKEQAQKHQLDQDKLQACVKKQDESAVRASMAEADKLGVDSTPTLFINGERFTGVIPEQELRAVLDRELAENGQQQPPANAKK
jgi:protein-disulfide isomerase